MRKSIWILASLAILVVAVSWWVFGGSGPSSEASASGQSAAVAASASPGSRRSADELEWVHPTATAQELAMPGGTPALKRPATEADGQLEIAVSAGPKPVASARVRVYLRGPRDPSTGAIQWRFAGGGATGPDGLLKVPARTGAYLIAARAEGFASARKEAVRAGGEKLTRVELSLEPGLSLRGRVVEKGSGAEVPMAELALTAIALHGNGSAPAEEKVHASADPRGHFEIPGLARGQYQLEARAPGRGKGSKLVTVPRSSELVIELGAASFIQGHVLASDGKPASGAEVTLTGSGDPEVVTAGQQGDFSAEVSPGEHHVSARSGSEAGSLPEGISVAPGVTRDVVVQLGKAAAIAGLVRSKMTKAPVAGAAVGLSPYDEEGDSGRATTGPDGQFVLEPLAPGAYDLVVAGEGYTEVMKKGVTVATGQRFFLTIEIDGTGAVEGTVRDSAGAPLAQAVVQGGQVWDGPFTSGAAAEVRTDADGRYRVTGLDIGQVRLSAGRKPGVWLAWEVVDVREDETAHLDFTLPEPGILQGRVTAKGGAPLDRAAEVSALPRTNTIGALDVRVAQVGADGRYRLELPPGQYSVGATCSDEGRRFNFGPIAAVEVEPGRTVDQDLEIPPENREVVLAGHVVEPDGSPSALATVFFSAPGRSRPMAGFGADEMGRFELAKSSGFVSGTYTLRAVNGGRTGELASVRSGAQDAVVSLRPGGSILGHLVGAGANVESYRVEAEILDPGFPSWAGSGQEFAGDTFELHDVPALAMRVTVSTPDGRIGSATTTVTPGGKAEVTVSLEAGGTITGRVIGPDHAPLSMAIAILDGAVYSSPTGTDGRFKFEKVAAGKRKLVVAASWMRSQEREITVLAGQNLDVGDVALERIRAEPGTVGANFSDDGSQVSIPWILQEGPAERAGVLRGDLLLAVDGQPVRTAQEANARTTGAPGSTVRLTLKRGGQQLQVDVIRGT